MQKHTTQRHKVVVRHPRAAPAQHAGKPNPVKKATVAKIAAPAMTAEPPRVIEVMELDFVDPDILLDESGVVTGFDEEDF